MESPQNGFFIILYWESNILLYIAFWPIFKQIKKLYLKITQRFLLFMLLFIMYPFIT